MAVFATLFGKLARHLSPDSLVKTLQTHIGLVPNPLSKRSKSLQPRIHDAKMVKSVCPYCAVGCGQRVYVKEGKVVDIEGDYDNPISQGCLCPKGSASYQLDINQRRWTTVKYCAPYSTVWEDRPLDRAMERIAGLCMRRAKRLFASEMKTNIHSITPWRLARSVEQRSINYNDRESMRTFGRARRRE